MYLSIYSRRSSAREGHMPVFANLVFSLEPGQEPSPDGRAQPLVTFHPSVCLCICLPTNLSIYLSAAKDEHVTVFANLVFAL